MTQQNNQRMAANANFDWQILTLTGRIDSFNQNSAQSEIRQSLQSGAQALAIDLGLVDFLSVTMIRFLVEQAQDLKRRGGQMALLRPSERIVKHFKVYGMIEPFLVIKNFEISQENGLAKPKQGTPAFWPQPVHGVKSRFLF